MRATIKRGTLPVLLLFGGAGLLVYGAAIHSLRVVEERETEEGAAAQDLADRAQAQQGQREARPHAQGVQRRAADAVARWNERVPA